jgi:hypothetical protein
MVIDILGEEKEDIAKTSQPEEKKNIPQYIVFDVVELQLAAGPQTRKKSLSIPCLPVEVRKR